MSTIELRSGAIFDFANPTAPIFTIDDIAHGLAGERRYANQLNVRNPHGGRGIYSVAEHSVHVLRLVEQRWSELCARTPGRYERPLTHNTTRWALGHDAPECVLRDFPGPGKDYVPGYRELEAKVLVATNAVFGITGTKEPPEVKLADTLVGQVEQFDLRGGPRPPEWALEAVRPLCWPEDLAACRFRAEWRRLCRPID